MGYERTHYQTLGVEESADDSTLRRAYRRLAKQWHPDLCRTDGAQERFREVDDAYRCLTDPLERARYDQSLRWQRARAWLTTPAAPGGTEGTWVSDVDRREPASPARAWQGESAYADPAEHKIAKVVGWLLAVAALITVVVLTWPDPIESPEFGPDGRMIYPDQPTPAGRSRSLEAGPPRRGRRNRSAGESNSPSRSGGHVSPYSRANPTPPR